MNYRLTIGISAGWGNPRPLMFPSPTFLSVVQVMPRQALSPTRAVSGRAARRVGAPPPPRRAPAPPADAPPTPAPPPPPTHDATPHTPQNATHSAHTLQDPHPNPHQNECPTTDSPNPPSHQSLPTSRPPAHTHATRSSRSIPCLSKVRIGYILSCDASVCARSDESAARAKNRSL